MALVETLISQITDTALREALAREVSDLKRRLSWGLVFERHIPESTRLLDAPIRVGSVVWERRTARPRRFRVRAIKGGQLTLVVEKAGTIAADDADTVTLARSEVLVEKPFSEPIFPTLTPIDAVRNGPPDRPSHAVIQGENYHTLEVLLAAYDGQVDVVYLDPPYNTGARDWTYNNDYVDASDQWAPSKWLSFMEKRLRLASRLLKPDGVMIITIDDHEVHHLGMLLEQMFPGSLISMITIVINPKGTGATNFARVEEYAFFVCPPGREVINSVPFSFGMPMTVAVRDHRVMEVKGGDGQLERKLSLRRDGAESSSRNDRPRQFYAIYVDPKTLEVTGIGPELRLEDEISTELVEGRVPVYPIDGKGRHRVWRYGRDTMTRRIDAGEIRVTRFDQAKGTYSLYHFGSVDPAKAERRRPRTVWWHSSHDAGAHGSSLLNEMLGGRAQFAFPKSVYAVVDTLRLVTGDRPDALVLDFFAGSGTTLHATLLLNAEDGGRRRCTLVTNNDVKEDTTRSLNREGHFRGDPEFESSGIFEAVTRPRVKTAISGARPDGTPLSGTYLNGRAWSEGFEENVEFFRLDYLDPIAIELGQRFADLHPLLWLKAGGIGERQAIDPAANFALPAGSPYGVLFDPAGMPGLLEGLADRPDITHVFIIADSDSSFADLASTLPREIETVQLYRAYLETLQNATA